MNFNTPTPNDGTFDDSINWNTLKDNVLQALAHACHDFDPPTLPDLPKYFDLWTTYQKTPNDETALTDWLIALFNETFKDKNTILVRGGDEPIYLAPKDSTSAQIVFAHGYFSSGLHEISHWCIAGTKRRLQDDFGYWYCPDGRDEATQKQFEQVEIKPQAVECLLTLATGRKFFTSADNLNADFDTSNSTFDKDVFAQSSAFLQNPNTLPKDAQTLLFALLCLCQPELKNEPPKDRP